MSFFLHGKPNVGTRTCTEHPIFIHVGKFMVSFDVESLFMNIPLEECIYLAVNYISEGNPDVKLTESELRRGIFTGCALKIRITFIQSYSWLP